MLVGCGLCIVEGLSGCLLKLDRYQHKDQTFICSSLNIHSSDQSELTSNPTATVVTAVLQV